MEHADVMADFGDVRLALDLAKLQAFMEANVAGFTCPKGLQAKQFNTGTSNPTYLVWSTTNERDRFVVRRKPSGKLLRGAHQIDREYRVMDALHGKGVPVPKMFAFCEDESILGAQFYIMECVPGRVLMDGGETLNPVERAALWDSISEGLAAMHAVDYRSVGLGDFSKTGNFAARQVSTWGKNFDAADAVVQSKLQAPQLTADMHELRDYLLANMTILEPEPTCVVHGDMGLHNMLIHPTEPRVAAFIDWEISTLGHPLVDLDYVSAGLPGGWRPGTIQFEGLPTAWEFKEAYHKKRGLQMMSQQVADFVSLVNMFRFCAITHGVLARGLSGNASSGSSRNLEMQAVYTGTLTKAAALLRSKGSPGKSSQARL